MGTAAGAAVLLSLAVLLAITLITALVVMKRMDGNRSVTFKVLGLGFHIDLSTNKTDTKEPDESAELESPEETPKRAIDP